METYRLSSKLREKEKEYLIQTANDAERGLVATMIYVDGVLAETVNCPHPADIKPQDILSFVKVTHGEKKKEVEALLQTYNRVLGSGDAETMGQLGTALYYKGLYHEARELFRGALVLNPQHHPSMNQLSLTELQLGNISASIDSGLKAIAARPRFADYRNNLGEAFLADGDCRRAAAEFEEAININLYYADAYFNLGLAHLLHLSANRDRAQLATVVNKVADCLNKACLIYPGYRGETLEAALAALKAGAIDKALYAVKSIRETKRESHRQEFAGFYMKFILFPEWASEKAIQDRIAFLKAEIAKNPTYVDLQTELAQCYIELSRQAWQKGIEHFRKTAELSPSMPKLQGAIEESEKAYAIICASANIIAEKG
jgi:tetratricopeptide (TPR) repeat protein